jgi:MFS family permease
LVFALAPSVVGLLVGRLLQGVGSQGANASSIALVMEVSENLSADMGLVEFVWGLGYMLGPPIGGLAFYFGGFTFAHMPAASLALLLAVSCIYLIRSDPHARDRANGAGGGGGDGESAYALLPQVCSCYGSLLKCAGSLLTYTRSFCCIIDLSFDVY